MSEDGSLGRTLRQAREARKLSLSVLATTTRIPLSHLEALESDSLGSLPADVYVRGFVRAYCRAVDLPETAPLAELDKVLSQRRNAAAGVPPGTPEEAGRPLMSVTPAGALGRRGAKITMVLAALAVLVAVIYATMIR